MASLMATFVTISTFLGIVIPLGETSSTFHLGNVTCLISGIILGPIYGGLAAAIGSVIFDILNPMYITSIPFTFVFKFIMVFICGTVAYNKERKGKNFFYNILGATLGSLFYVLLRSIKSLILNLYFLKMEFFSAIFFTLSGTAISILKMILTIIAVGILIPIIKEKISEKNLI